jgi:hypothetical protein
MTVQVITTEAAYIAMLIDIWNVPENDDFDSVFTLRLLPDLLGGIGYQLWERGYATAEGVKVLAETHGWSYEGAKMVEAIMAPYRKD